MDKKQIIQEDRYLIPYHYLDIYSDEHKLLHHVPYLDRITKALDIGIQGNVLDIGCGDGRLIFEGQKYKKYRKFVGIDYSINAIKFARIINKDADFYIEDLTSLNSNLDIKDFDNIFCLETLEHIQIDKIDNFLRNCESLLNENGLAIFSVPSSFFPCEEKHYQHFSEYDLYNLLSKYFKVVKIFGLENQKGFKKIIINFYFRVSKLFFPLRHLKFFNYLSKIYYNNYKLISEGNTNTCSGLMCICKKK